MFTKPLSSLTKKEGVIAGFIVFITILLTVYIVTPSTYEIVRMLVTK